MELIIDQKIIQTFEGLNIGVVIAKEIDNNTEVGEIQDRIKQRQEEIRTNLNQKRSQMIQKSNAGEVHIQNWGQTQRK